jgi:prepilin-type N-terminal cleavage/methylation domain-containing protein/prepilin-type processing-associated H-X9-DG protein
MKDSRAFTLVELLVAMAVIGVLAVLATGIYAATQKRAAAVQCLNQLRSLGTAFQLYAQENDGEFPRSSHSSFAYRVYPWERAICPYLGVSTGVPSVEEWTRLSARHFSCPAHEKREETNMSYGLNAYYELAPDADDYPGSPQTWRRLLQVPNPSRTVVLAELRDTSVDHVMAHFWTGSGSNQEVAQDRHGGESNYLFADGHAELLPLVETFDPASKVNLWNPGLAK